LASRRHRRFGATRRPPFGAGDPSEPIPIVYLLDGFDWSSPVWEAQDANDFSTVIGTVTG
jgi:hypothetical protein